jgi:hypothetical protein
MGGIMVITGLMFASQFSSYGYINTGKRAFIPTFGKTAILIICVILSSGTFFILWSGYLFLCRREFFRRGDFSAKADLPEYVVCVKCDKVFSGTAVENNKCPVCSGMLEELKDFYERHPDFPKRDFRSDQAMGDERKFFSIPVLFLLIVTSSVVFGFLLAWMTAYWFFAWH